MKTSQPKFIEFDTKDGLTLPGLLYEAGKRKSVVIYLHGNGSSSVFYDEAENRVLAEALSKKDTSILYFNNRGAHIIKKLYVRRGKEEERKRFGMAYEKIKDCIIDIDGAIAFLKKQGYRKFYLAGASTGANKICVYNFYKPENDVEKYILLCGGDDTGIYYDMLGKQKFWKLLETAKKKIKVKQGEEIIKEMLPDNFFSHIGFFDIANPDGDYNIFPFYEVLRKVKLSTKPLFRHFKSIRKPTLVVYGDQDEYAWGSVPKIVEILEKYQPRMTYRVIKGADHGFKNHEKELAKMIADWL
jgi:pimeloyl-ACP methyl ester carboxylesterase